MESANPVQKNTVQPITGGTALDKCFFAQKSAMKIQYNKDTNAIYIGVGKKDENNHWTWKNAKIKDTEGARIIQVIIGEINEISFYHTFDEKETKIWIRRKDDNVYFRIEDNSKPLDSAEQVVLRIILEEAIRLTAQRSDIA